MPRAGRRRLAAAIALSAGFHLALLIVLAIQAPMLRAPPEGGAGPPEPIIPLLLMPKAPPSKAQKPQAVRLHRRPQPFAAPPPIEPLPVPAAPPASPRAQGPSVFHPAPLPEGPKADIRATLRGSAIGCATPEFLSPSERDRCNEALGKGAKTSTMPGLGLSAAKQAEFDRQVERKDACRDYRATPGAVMPRLRDGMC